MGQLVSLASQREVRQREEGGSAKSESLDSFSQRRERHTGVTGEEPEQGRFREDREEDFS